MMDLALRTNGAGNLNMYFLRDTRLLTLQRRYSEQSKV